MRKFVTAALGALAASLAFGASAQAFDVSGTGVPEEVTAGAHSNVNIRIDVAEPEADIRDLTVHLPPGLVGDPTGPSICTIDQLNANSCPATSQVGTSSSTAALDPVPVPVITASGNIYNVTPQPGEPARFGIVLDDISGLPNPTPIILQSGAQLRQSDYGLDSVLEGLPNTASGLPISIHTLDLTLFGTVNEGTEDEAPFLRNPTSCTEKQISFDAVSYADEEASGNALPFTPTNCPALDFSPELTAEVQGVATGAHPQLTTVISQEATEAGLKDAEVILPAELQPNNDALGDNCTIAEFQADECPAEAIIGSAVASSPLQNNPLTGDAYLLLDSGNLGVGLDLQGDLSFKLVGKFVFDEQFRTGNLFEDLPDIPISEFELTIAGGEGGLLTASRNICEPPPLTGSFDFTGHNAEQLTGDYPTDVTDCPDLDPTATVDVPNPGAKHPDLDLDVTAGSDPVKKVKLKLPGALRFAAGKKFKRGSTGFADGGELPDSKVKGKPHRAIIDGLDADDSVALEVRRKALDKARNGPLEFVVTVVEADGDKFTVGA